MVTHDADWILCCAGLNKFWAFGGNVVAMNKDSCGVGFVAELSGESSRKTVNATTLVFACECEYEYGACGVRFYNYVSFLR